MTALLGFVIVFLQLAREDKMVRVLLTAIAISLVVGVFPAFAQGSGGCSEWCRANRCSTGSLSGRNANCMPRCIEGCQNKHKSKK
jgi:hypothetical protein